MRKTSDKHKLRGILQHTWLVLFKTIKIKKSKEKTKNMYQPKKTKELWQLNAVSWAGSWKQEKRIFSEKTGEIQTNSST